MMPTGQAAAQAASDGRECGYGEHLLVWSWRRIVAGKLHCPVMAKEFADACGKDAGRVFLVLCAFLKALAYASRRQLTIRAPDPFCVTSDERQMLTLLAAAQAEDHVLFQAHLDWLARPARRHELRIAAQALATALDVNNIPLALPPPATPGSRERPRAVT